VVISGFPVPPNAGGGIATPEKKVWEDKENSTSLNKRGMFRNTAGGNQPALGKEKTYSQNTRNLDPTKTPTAETAPKTRQNHTLEEEIPVRRRKI